MPTYITLWLLGAFFCICPIALQAQTAAAKGQIQVAPIIETMLQAYTHQVQQGEQTMAGFRIQIAQDSNREATRAEKGNALLKFPQYEAYESYDSPTFKIRVGDFKTRISAYKALNDLKSTFKRAFIVEDRIQIATMQ